MIMLVKRVIQALRPRSAAEKELEKGRMEEARLILFAELNQVRIDGKPVSHRRLESLMLASGTSRTEATRLLRRMGARRSTRRGVVMWSLKPQDR